MWKGHMDSVQKSREWKESNRKERIIFRARAYFSKNHDPAVSSGNYLKQGSQRWHNAVSSRLAFYLFIYLCLKSQWTYGIRIENSSSLVELVSSVHFPSFCVCIFHGSLRISFLWIHAGGFPFVTWWEGKLFGNPLELPSWNKPKLRNHGALGTSKMHGGQVMERLPPSYPMW